MDARRLLLCIMLSGVVGLSLSQKHTPNPSADMSVCDKRVLPSGLCLFTSRSMDLSKREIAKARYPACQGDDVHNGQCLKRADAAALCAEYDAELCDSYNLKIALHNMDYDNCMYGWLQGEKGDTGAIGYASEPHKCGNAPDYTFVDNNQAHGAYCCKVVSTEEEVSAAANDTKAYSFNWDYYDDCSAGDLQSPINIDRNVLEMSTCAPGNGLDMYYTSELKLLGRNADWTLSFEEGRGSYIMFNKVAYRLESVVFKSPSDHTFDGKNYPGELQFVHIARDVGGNSALGVLSVMIDVGTGAGAMTPSQFDAVKNADPLYSTFSQLLSELEGKGTAATDHIKWATQSVMPENKDYIFYVGSLTVPPCTEGVNWWVLEHPIVTPTMDIINMFREHFGANQRPVKPLGSRTLARCNTNFHTIQPGVPAANVTTDTGSHNVDVLTPSN